MINILTLVGRIVSNLELKEDETGRKYINMTIMVSRAYKNEEGAYDTDFIDCLIFGSIAETTCEYCRKGNTIGIKGRLETRYNDNNDKYMVVVADRVSFLSSAKKESEE